jgi:hypothetical protein
MLPTIVLEKNKIKNKQIGVTVTDCHQCSWGEKREKIAIFCN